jgi:septal ring factor EnvC (AmiA/AmiB activator)
MPSRTTVASTELEALQALVKNLREKRGVYSTYRLMDEAADMLEALKSEIESKRAEIERLREALSAARAEVKAKDDGNKVLAEALLRQAKAIDELRAENERLKDDEWDIAGQVAELITMRQRNEELTTLLRDCKARIYAPWLIDRIDAALQEPRK